MKNKQQQKFNKTMKERKRRKAYLEVLTQERVKRARRLREIKQADLKAKKEVVEQNNALDRKIKEERLAKGIVSHKQKRINRKINKLIK